MKSKSGIWLIVLTIIFSGVIVALFYYNISKREKYIVNNPALLDSIDGFNIEKSYVSQLLVGSFTENGRSHNFDDISFFELNDEKKESPKKIASFLKTPGQKLLIRYTEIGCNSCADSTFKYLKKFSKLDSLFSIHIFVDFSNYDAYLKWRKVTEVPYPVHWVKKGDLPFKIESKDYSYIFTITPNLHVDNFFIPNSRFSKYLETYFDILNLKY